MPLSWLDANAAASFPAVELAEDGLLAAGGDLSPARLLKAYQHGVFPWFNKGEPILWWSPDPRMVLFTEQLKLSKSLKKTLRTTAITVSFDQAFEQVITACSMPRIQHAPDDENCTWIHDDMIQAYMELHKQGYAHSVECWLDGQLIGGLYGVAIGKMFFGESMFSLVRDSSKIALATLCQQLQQWGFPLIDCQVYSSHLASLGAVEIDRRDFIDTISILCQQSSPVKLWDLDLNSMESL